MKTRGPHPSHEGGGCAPLGARPYLVGPLVALRRQLQLHILAFGEKKIREKKSLRLRYGAAASPNLSREG